MLACALYMVEFVADKVPAFNSVWDAVHTFVRVPAGAVLASAAFAHFDPAVRIAALLPGGDIALGSHGTKATTRIGANLSPEPFSNVVLSFVEDLVVIGCSFVIASHPVVMIAIVAAFLCAIAWLFPKLLRTLRSFLKGAFRKCYT